MDAANITFCNRAYAEKWYNNLRRQNPDQRAIIESIIEEIEIKDGGDISKRDIIDRNPDIKVILDKLDVDIVPSRGQMLKHNGNGIRHAKFAPSKSTAIVWEKIGDAIFVTFDDHAPIRYHRAISHLRDIKLGRVALPKRARVSGRFLRRLRLFWLDRNKRRFKGFTPRDKYYE